jgi:outer membrane lipoprotein-sorting protein
MRRLTALVTLFVVMAASAFATDVKDIIAKNIEAKGGLSKMKAIKTLVREGTMSMAQGMELNFTQSFKRKNKMRMDMAFQGMSIVSAFDGETAWSMNPMAGNKPEKQSAEESKQALEQADFDGDLVDYLEKGKKVEYLSTEDIDGTTAYKLKITAKDGKESFLYIDATTNLEMRLDTKFSMMGQEADVEMVFSNFQDVNGVQMANLMEMRSDGQTMMSMTYTSNKANVDLPDSRFAFPAETEGGKK